MGRKHSAFYSCCVYVEYNDTNLHIEGIPSRFEDASHLRACDEFGETAFSRRFEQYPRRPCDAEDEGFGRGTVVTSLCTAIVNSYGG